MKKFNLKSLSSLALALPLASCTTEEERPNIVLFLIDDLGWLDTSVAFGEQVYPFNLRHDTPNIAHLAESGAIMTSAYVCPVSTPTRTSIMSGMNAAHTRITNFTSVRKDWNPDATDTPSAQERDVINRTEWNINGVTPSSEPLERSVHITPYPQILKDNGYYTIHVGKGHWAPNGTPAANPYNMGFCVNVAGQVAGKPRSYYGEENYGNTADKWNFFSVQNMTEYYGTSTHLTEALTLEALKTLDYPIDNGIPFYLNFCHHAVHTPIHRDPRFFQKYVDRGMDEGQARFASMCEGMDKSLGDLMAYLDKRGVLDNTIIVFMSDNGGNSENLSKGGVRHTQNSPLREGKASCYEAGIRVPMVVYWKGKVAAGTRLNTPVVAEDIYPTILEMAGIEEYTTVQNLDGKSLVRLLTDGSNLAKRAMERGEITNQKQANDFVVPQSISGIEPEREVLAHYPHQWKPYQLSDIDYMSSLRRGDWKIIYRHREQKLELYNIGEDITERNDLSATHPEKLQEMADALTAKLEGYNALLPTFRSTGERVPMPNQLLNQ
ncbi:MAG: sulfatase [Alistipes sp.]|nr:sulfatase [Alistipes sp.]